MGEVAAQVVLVASVCATFFAGPGAALFFLIRRKKRARSQRRSPIAKSLLRSPGHTLNEQLAQANEDVIFDLMVLMVVPLMTLALFFGQIYIRPGSNQLHLGVIYGIGAVGTVAFLLRKLVNTGTRLDHLKAGYDAEVAVGQELDQLMRRGAYVFHDVPGENFNIDHVVVSARGVFAVETKGYTKAVRDGNVSHVVEFDGRLLRFPTWSTSEPLEQSERQSRWLSQWLAKATGDSVRVQAVLALPGWFVELKGRGAVRVFNGAQLSGLLDSRGVAGLSLAEVTRVAHQIEQRCRTVEPRYRDDEKAT